MEITTHELTGSNINLLRTEILYFIVSARALNKDLIRLNFSGFDPDKIEAKVLSVIRILKSVKREGRIQLYIHSSDLNGNSTESQYLLNKYPSLSELNTDEFFFILKL